MIMVMIMIIIKIIIIVIIILIIIIKIVKMKMMLIRLTLLRPSSSNKGKILDRSFISKDLILTYLFIRFGSHRNLLHQQTLPNTGAEFTWNLVLSLKTEYADAYVADS